MRIKSAFSFAEILVTLMIIGVIAAMTIPALRKDSMNKTIATNLKKIYSEMNQATSLALANNSTNRMYRTGLLDDAAIFENEFIKKYFNVAQECEEGSADNCFGSSEILDDTNKTYILTSGIAIQFQYQTSYNTKDFNMNIIVDVNGPKSPNKAGTDQFIMQMNGLGQTYLGSMLSTETSKSNYDNNCASDDDYTMAWACAAKIQLDGWEIKY